MLTRGTQSCVGLRVPHMRKEGGREHQQTHLVLGAGLGRPCGWGVVRRPSNCGGRGRSTDQLLPFSPQCPLYLCPPLEALEQVGLPLSLGLEGEHQRHNAALALQLARCWLEQQNYHGRWASAGTQVGREWSLPWSEHRLMPHRHPGAEGIQAKHSVAAAAGTCVPPHAPHETW